MRPRLRGPAPRDLGSPDGSPLLTAALTLEDASGVSAPVDPPALAPTLRCLHPRPAGFDHRVQFYDRDEFLYETVAEFLAEGVAAGEPMVVIATDEHRRHLLQRFGADGVDHAALTVSGRLVLLDAEATLAQFMVDGLPDRALFRSLVGGLFGRLQAVSGNGRVRAYGEMVDLLWRDGHSEATLALESLWNELGKDGLLSLLCGYSISGFDQSGHAKPLRDVCDSHEQVAPAESYSQAADSQARLRQITQLQQRALVLEREVEHRRRLEQVLQDALLQRRRVEDQLLASQEELKAMEQELRRQNEDLSRTVRFSEMFVGMLGHDLRNPLSAIATAASLLRRRADSEKVTKPADRILNSAGRMGRMIDQLLDFTRIRLGEGIPIEPKQSDLAEICKLAVQEVQATGKVPTVQLSGVGDFGGWWDGERLLQLISNLLCNAVVHGAEAEPITIRMDGNGAALVVLQIHNKGVVPSSMVPLLFEPFRSALNSKQEGSHGLGLGLFISQQIARAHGGQIAVTTSDSDGTCFTVTLPRVSGVPAAQAAPPGERA